MRIYLGKDRQNATQVIMTVTHTTLRSLTRRVEGICHKLFIDSFISSPCLFDNLCTRGINCSRTVKIIKECQRAPTLR
jgi:hypothetical protein